MNACALFALWLTFALGGCGAAAKVAVSGTHAPGDAVEVPYPPPPARVQELPARPQLGCVWVDGYWDYSDRWEWQAGEWVVPDPTCSLAGPELRREGGLLRYARPRWYPSGRKLLGPESACARPAACQTSPSQTRAVAP